jgi:hypothetical protein
VSAEVPANDEIEQAVPVSRLPFSHTVDLAEATEGAADLDCSGLADTHTVWYAITLQADARVGLRIDTEVTEVSVAVGSGEPGSLDLALCTFARTVAFQATAGTTYYIQLATAGEAEGGPVTLSMVSVPPLTVVVALDRGATLDANGTLTVGGTVRCNRATPPGSELVVQGTVVQGESRGWLIPVHFPEGCRKSPPRWRAAVQLLSSTPFSEGRADLSATAFACDPFVCAEPDRQSVPLRIR